MASGEVQMSGGESLLDRMSRSVDRARIGGVRSLVRPGMVNLCLPRRVRSRYLQGLNQLYGYSCMSQAEIVPNGDSAEQFCSHLRALGVNALELAAKNYQFVVGDMNLWNDEFKTEVFNYISTRFSNPSFAELSRRKEMTYVNELMGTAVSSGMQFNEWMGSLRSHMDALETGLNAVVAEVVHEDLVPDVHACNRLIQNERDIAAVRLNTTNAVWDLDLIDQSDGGRYSLARSLSIVEVGVSEQGELVLGGTPPEDDRLKDTCMLAKTGIKVDLECSAVVVRNAAPNGPRLLRDYSLRNGMQHLTSLYNPLFQQISLTSTLEAYFIDAYSIPSVAARAIAGDDKGNMVGLGMNVLYSEQVEQFLSNMSYYVTSTLFTSALHNFTVNNEWKMTPVRSLIFLRLFEEQKIVFDMVNNNMDIGQCTSVDIMKNSLFLAHRMLYVPFLVYYVCNVNPSILLNNKIIVSEGDFKWSDCLVSCDCLFAISQSFFQGYNTCSLDDNLSHSFIKLMNTQVNYKLFKSAASSPSISAVQLLRPLWKRLQFLDASSLNSYTSSVTSVAVDCKFIALESLLPQQEGVASAGSSYYMTLLSESSISTYSNTVSMVLCNMTWVEVTAGVHSQGQFMELTVDGQVVNETNHQLVATDVILQAKQWEVTSLCIASSAQDTKIVEREQELQQARAHYELICQEATERFVQLESNLKDEAQKKMDAERKMHALAESLCAKEIDVNELMSQRSQMEEYSRQLYDQMLVQKETSQQLEDNHKRLMNAYNELKETQGASTTAIMGMEQKVADADLRLQQSADLNKNLDEQLNQYKSRMIDNQAHIAASERSAAAAIQELSQLKVAYDQIQSELSRRASEYEEASLRFASEISSYQETIARNRTALDTLYQEKLQLQSKVSELELSLAGLRTEYDGLKIKLDSEMKQLQQDNALIHERYQELVQREHLSSEVTVKLVTLQGEMASKDRELLSSKERLSESEKLLLSLTEELNQVKESKRKAELDNEGLLRKVSEQEVEIEELNRKLACLQVTVDGKNKMIQQLQEMMECQTKDMQEQVLRATSTPASDTSNLLKEFQQRYNGLQSTIQQKEDEIAALNDKLRKLSENIDYKAKYEEQLLKYQELYAEKEKLLTDMEGMKRDKKKIEDDYIYEKKKSETMADTERALQETNVRIAELEGVIVQLELKVSMLTVELNRARSTAMDSTKYNQLSQELLSAQTELIVKTKELSEMTSRVISAEAEVNRLRMQLQSTENDLHAVQDDYLKLKTKKEKMEMDLDQAAQSASAMVSALREEIAIKDSELQAMSTRIVAYVTEVSSLQAQLTVLSSVPPEISVVSDAVAPTPVSPAAVSSLQYVFYSPEMVQYQYKSYTTAALRKMMSSALKNQLFVSRIPNSRNYCLLNEDDFIVRSDRMPARKGGRRPRNAGGKRRVTVRSRAPASTAKRTPRSENLEDVYRLNATKDVENKIVALDKNGNYELKTEQKNYVHEALNGDNQNYKVVYHSLSQGARLKFINAIAAKYASLKSSTDANVQTTVPILFSLYRSGSLSEPEIAYAFDKLSSSTSMFDAMKTCMSAYSSSQKKAADDANAIINEYKISSGELHHYLRRMGINTELGMFIDNTGMVNWDLIPTIEANRISEAMTHGAALGHFKAGSTSRSILTT